jgi:hypothetical protein
MSDNNTETIYLRLGTADQITLDDFIDSISDFKNVLQNLDATIAGRSQGNMIWDVVLLEKNSPAVIGVAPRTRKGREDTSHYVEHQLIENARLLSAKGERTQYLSDQALGKIERLSKRTVRLGPMDLYLNGNGPVRDLAQITTETLTRVKELTSPRYTEFGSLQGGLESISIHRGHEFRIWNEDNNRPVKCIFNPKEIDQVKALLGEKVVVTGMIQSNAARLPISIKIEDLREAPKFEVPTIDEMIGLVPDITEGLSLSEYLKRLSNE